MCNEALGDDPYTWVLMKKLEVTCISFIHVVLHARPRPRSSLTITLTMTFTRFIKVQLKCLNSKRGALQEESRAKRKTWHEAGKNRPQVIKSSKLMKGETDRHATGSWDSPGVDAK